MVHLDSYLWWFQIVTFNITFFDILVLEWFIYTYTGDPRKHCLNRERLKNVGKDWSKFHVLLALHVVLFDPLHCGKRMEMVKND